MKIIDNKKENIPIAGDIVKVKHDGSTKYYYDYDYYLIAEKWSGAGNAREYMLVNIRNGKCLNNVLTKNVKCLNDKITDIDEALESIFLKNYEVIDSNDIELIIKK